MAASWQQRFDSAKPTYTRTNEKKFADLEAGTSILIPSPVDIQGQIDLVEPGATLTLTELRARLAAAHGADGTCPVMCGMNLRIVAEVVFEALDAGVPQAELSPVWQVIDPKSNIASKLVGGPARVSELRARGRATEQRAGA